MTSSWTQTVTGHHRWLHRWLVGKAAPDDPVEDLVQETLQCAIAQGQPKQPIADVQGWLAGIARNKLRQHIDRSVRERRLNGNLLGTETTGTVVPLPLDFLILSERHDLIRSALETLDEEPAALLRAKYLDGSSYQDLSKRFGWSLDTVANRLRTARRQLRETLIHLSKS